MPSALSTRVPGWTVTAAAVLVLLGVLAVNLALREPPAGGESPAASRPPMRVPLFIKPEDVHHGTRFRFTFDPPEALAGFRAAEKLDQVVAGASDDLDRFRRLLAWTRAQFEPGVPDPYPPLDARIILRDTRSGFTGGFCAQYNYVLGQALMSLGYPARYVTVRDHEVLEVWARDRQRWICLDPLHAATYVDEEGRPLSVHEICLRARRGQPPLPGEGSLPGTATQVAGAFGGFAVWIRNDHISRPINFSDIERYKVTFLFSPGEAAGLPPEALRTSEIGDLYFDPGETRGGQAWMSGQAASLGRLTPLSGQN